MKAVFLNRLALLHGVTIGLALAAGLWLPGVISLWGVPLAHFYPTLAFGTTLLVAIAGLAGLFSARLSHAGLNAAVWFVAGLVITGVIGALLYQVQTLAAWLADLRFWGQPIYEVSSVSLLRAGFAGFFVVLVLAAYGLLQENRLDGLRAELDTRFWLTGRGWFLLLIGLVPVVAVGLIANTIVLQPVYATPGIVDRAIRLVRNTEDDLLALSQADGINYTALRNQRDQLDDAGAYTLQIGQIEWGPINTFHIVVEFENGVWLVCHLMGNRLSHCEDASPPYFVGFPALMHTEAFPADCMDCRFRVTEAQQAWLTERRDAFSGSLAITKAGQLGDVVLLQVQGDSTNDRIRCFFKGITPIVLESCWDSEP